MATVFFEKGAVKLKNGL